MKEQIKRILTIQWGAFLGVWTAPLLIVVLNETGVFNKGIYQESVQMSYALQSIGILFTIAMIPAALRMFNQNLMNRIKEMSLRDALKSYQRWGEVRLCLLFVPAVLNFTFYYLTLNSTCLFCALMPMLATLFCVPSESRIKNELDLPEEIND